MALATTSVCPVILTVTARQTQDDPPVEIFSTRLEHDEGIWTQAFGSLEQLQAYICGVRSLASMLGYHLPEPTIPRAEI